MVKADAYGLGAVAVARARAARPWCCWSRQWPKARSCDVHRSGRADRRVHPARARRLRRCCPRRSDLDPDASRSSAGVPPADLGISPSTRGMSRAGAPSSGPTSRRSTTRGRIPTPGRGYVFDAWPSATMLLRDEQGAPIRGGVSSRSPRVRHWSTPRTVRPSSIAPSTMSARPGIFLYGVGSGMAPRDHAGACSSPCGPG